MAIYWQTKVAVAVIGALVVSSGCMVILAKLICLTAPFMLTSNTPLVLPYKSSPLLVLAKISASCGPTVPLGSAPSIML